MPRTMLHEKRSHAGHGRQIRTIRIPRRKPYLQRQAQSQLHAPFCIHKPLGHYRTKSSMTRIRLRPAASFRCDESGRVTVRYVPTAYWVPNRHARSSKPSGSSQATRQQDPQPIPIPPKTTAKYGKPAVPIDVNSKARRENRSTCCDTTR